MKSKEITDAEWDLIDSIRNYHTSYPNGARQQKIYIFESLQELIDR